MPKVVISYRREKIKKFGKIIGMDLAFVLAVSFLVGLVTFLLRWLIQHEIPVLTDRDIIDLSRLTVKYSISSWWEFLFVYLWGILLYYIIVSRHLKKKLGQVMKIVYFIIVAGSGIYCALTYHGFLYGLIISLAVAALPPLLLLINYLWRKAKPIFFSNLSSPD